MSDTPRTDAEEHWSIHREPGPVVSSNFARALERELAESKKQAQLKAKLADELAEALQQTGEWDEGCFYYSGRAAPELGVILSAYAEATKKAGEAALHR